jgi:hypothetical protein
LKKAIVPFGRNLYSSMEKDIITKLCPYCGEEVSLKALKCKHCGEWLDETPYREESVSQPQVIVKQIERKTNGIGTAGFVISLVCTCLSWLPGVNLVLWFIGLLLSFVGMFKRPRGLAIAGFIISIIDFILIVVILGAIGVLLSGLIE